MKYNEQELALLDMFAGQALNGILANPERDGGMEQMIEASYVVAEAMLEERKKFIE